MFGYLKNKVPLKHNVSSIAVSKWLLFRACALFHVPLPDVVATPATYWEEAEDEGTASTIRTKMPNYRTNINE